MALIDLPPVGEEASVGTKVLGQVAWDTGFLKYLRGGAMRRRAHEQLSKKVEPAYIVAEFTSPSALSPKG